MPAKPSSEPRREVMGGLAEEHVPDPSAHQVGLSAGRLDFPGDLEEAALVTRNTPFGVQLDHVCTYAQRNPPPAAPGS